MTDEREMLEIARGAREAAAAIAGLDTELKNGVLRALADRLLSERGAIAAANRRDLDAGAAAGLPRAKLQRLELTGAGIEQMAAGLRQIADLPDPVGAVTRDYTVPSSLHVRKVRCPLGVIMMIYEARPNVTIDAFALCFKAGNACILKGGREAVHSNRALRDAAAAVLHARGLPAAAISIVTTSDREQLKSLLKLDGQIDLVIPRGGAELIRFVHEHSRIPTVQHFHGVCHIYVDESADIERAVDVCLVAKTSAPATCNAVEAVLVHRAAAGAFVPRFVAACEQAGVQVRGDAEACELAPAARPAAEGDWGREFLDLVVALRVVDDLDAAIGHIHRYGSNHTEAILTQNDVAAARFVERVRSSCVLVNASTRFNDGFQLGLGAEIGISTSRIHAYGPMGLEQLTIERYVVHGTWQTR